MDAIKLQNKIYAGYGKAALRIGLDNAQYRPTDSVNPLAAQIATVKASYNAEDMKYGKANQYGQSLWWGLFDARTTQVGDYLVGPQGTFFIASQQLHLPIQCVQCNGSVRVLGQSDDSSVGAMPYSGACAADSTDALGQRSEDGSFGVGWPASILLKGRSEITGTGLPGATRNMGWMILLPPSVPIVIDSAAILLDNLGRRYAVQGAELTDMGWRLQSIEEHA